jgi:Holliday junction resolvase RusA-like endonuclease
VTIPQTAVTLHLDMLPPTVNHQYKSIGGGRKALTDEVLTFRQLVALAVRGLTMEPDSDLACTVIVTFGVRRKGSHRLDVDNRIKSLSDALGLALHFDDCRIVEWHAYAERGAVDGLDVTLEVRNEE